MTDGRQAYRIRVEGMLDERWSGWFDGMTVTFESGTTILIGALADQAALRGIMDKIWDLNLNLISVNRIEMDSKQVEKEKIK